LKRVVSGIMVILWLTSVLILALNIQPAKAIGIIYIRAEGSIDPPTANIATIDNVTYTFTDNINDSIVVEKNDIVIDGAGYTLRGYVLEWGWESGSRGIDLTGRTNVTIQNMQIRNFNDGIWLEGSSSNNINGNSLIKNGYGVRFQYSCNYNSVSRNNITDGGIEFDYSSDYNIVFENSFTATYDVSILLYGSSNNSIYGNNITNSLGSGGHGSVWLYESSNNSIFGNNITANSLNGITVSYDSSYNSIHGNNITANGGGGIWLFWYSSCNNIYGNNIANRGTYGILLTESSTNNSIYENKVANNSNGISLATPNNTIYGNTIINNVDYGVCLIEASDNKFYHNSINNTQNVYDWSWRDPQYYSPSTNVWDDGYPSGGNYWMDYNGTDFFSGLYQNETGSDGIGDVPYVIDGNNADRYPLMLLRGDLNQDGTVDIYDAILAALAFGTYPGHPEWDPRVDLNQDDVIDIFDIIILATNFGRH